MAEAEGANTFTKLSPLMKEAYPKPEKANRKKKKRFSKIADLLAR